MRMKRQDPDYTGYRGNEGMPPGPSRSPMQAVKCSVCGRKRNVPVDIAREAGDSYVCAACQQAKAEKEPS